MDTEKVYRYPRLFIGVVEALSTIAVLSVVVWLFSAIFAIFWSAAGIDRSLFTMLPLLASLAEALRALAPIDPLPEPVSWPAMMAALTQLQTPLIACAATLLIVLLARNSLPAVRTSPRGMLVEFAGDWLPIPWESIKVIKVTEANERYVLIAETDRSALTGWHRFYSLIYGLRFKPGFLVTSAINDFDDLVRTLLSETDRVARVIDNARPAQLKEDATSPLFRLLLSPSGFFAQRSKPVEPRAPQAPAAVPGSRVLGSYPARIRSLTRGVALVLLAFTLLRYLILWMSFLALTFPAARNLPLFNLLDLRVVPATWWLLVAAHVLLAAMLLVCAVLYNLLPDLEARPEGLAVRYFNRWSMVPWAHIHAVKVTELTEQSQVVLIQAEKGLPLIARCSSLLYDGSLRPGILVTSAIENYEPLLQRTVLEVVRNPAEALPDDALPVFQSEARSDALMLSFQSAHAIDRLVEDARADETTLVWNRQRILRVVPPMLWLGLLPTLIFLADTSVLQGIIPDGRMLAIAVVIFFLGLLEWPLVATAVTVLDEMSGGGEEGNRAFYLYPVTQLPRLLPLGVALIALLIGVSWLAPIFWIAAIVWSFLLAAGLWGALYDWRGSQLLTGGLIPVLYQILMLIGYLLARS